MVNRPKFTRIFLTLWLACLLPLFWAGWTQAQTLTAEVDRAAISTNETLSLRIRYQGAQAQSDPDLSTLHSQFDILSNQKSSQHSIINGRVSVATEWSLVLSPRSSGQVLIPPFQVDGATSKPITILVEKGRSGNATGEDVFVEVSVDKPEVYVNEQFLITYTLYFNQTVDSLDKPELVLPDTRLQALDNVTYQKTLGQTRYGVAEYRFAAFADNTGTIVIPEQTWMVRTTDAPNVGRFSMGMGRVKLYRPKTEAVNVTVKPRPDSYPANSAWLPAEDVTLSEQWSRPPSELKVGEPITWSIEINTRGASSEQIPPILEHLKPSGYKTYPDQPSHSTTLGSTGVRGTRSESVAIVPSQAGELTLPPVELTWWDTKSGGVKVARLPAKTVFVAAGDSPAASPAAPAGAAAVSTAPATEPATTQTEYRISPLLLALTLLLLCSNAVLAVLYWRSKNRAAATGPEHANPANAPSKGLKQLLADCANAEPARIRAGLLSWGREQWPDEAVTLHSIAGKSTDQAFKQALRALDASLYGGSEATLDRAALARGIQALASHKKTAGPHNLAPLYSARS